MLKQNENVLIQRMSTLEDSKFAKKKRNESASLSRAFVDQIIQSKFSVQRTNKKLLIDNLY